MYNETVRPLTNGMKDLLRELAYQEIHKLEPLPMKRRHSKGLLTGGMIDAKRHRVGNKMIMSIFLNENGKKYLLELQNVLNSQQ